MDQVIRDLERKAEMGDPEARKALGIAKCRIGQHCYHVESGQGYVSIYEGPSFGCCHCKNAGKLTQDYDQLEFCGPYKPHDVLKSNWRIE